FAEPDLAQRWFVEGDETLAVNKRPQGPAPQRGDYPHERDDDWFRDDRHGQFRRALATLGEAAGVVRVAHLDTGYDPQHLSLPSRLRRDLGRSFIPGEEDKNAEDRTEGAFTQLGHGTGTLGLLAGRDPVLQTNTIGAAPFVEIVPLRVANSVVLFSN